MRHFYNFFKVGGSTTATILIISSIAFSQNHSAEFKTVHVKFKEHFKPGASVSGRTSGIGKFDLISEKHNAISIKRIFPDAGVFEEAHQAYGLHLWYEIKFSKDAKLKNILEDYRRTDNVDNVEESRPYSSIQETNMVEADKLSTLLSGSNDPFLASQWHFENTGQTGGTPAADINLIKAWQFETGSPNVIVAVIDGGIDLNHPDLKSALWVNADEIPKNGIDDDNNGYVDDIHGYGFADQSSIISPHNHGTHVAGTIGAVSNNGIGVAGIAGGNSSSGGVKLMSCVGFGNFRIGGFEEAMVYAADNGAVISQNSWGGGSSSIEAAISYFINRAGYDNSSTNFGKNIQTGPMAGGVVVFAAGNSNTSDPYYGYPASSKNVIAVAATDHNDLKSQFSNYGEWVDICAPGTNVYSTKASSYGPGYGLFSGTSMACPHVSGVAALIVSNFQRTGLKPSEVWSRLRFSAKSIVDKNPHLSGQLGWGRLDAFNALNKEVDAILPGAITDLRIEETHNHSTSLLLSWTASGENNNEGRAAQYDMRYSTSPINESNFYDAISIQNLPIPPFSGEKVTFEVTDLTPFTTYYFGLKSIDIFSGTSPLSNIASVRTLSMPIPELITTEITEQLFTGTVSTKYVLVKNTNDGDELLVRTGVPNIQASSTIPPIGSKGRLFAINTLKNTIEELDSKTGKIIHSIPLPVPSSKRSEGLAFDGISLFYGRSNQIYKINTETGEVIRTINLNGTTYITGLAWSGRYLYVSRYSSGGYRNTLEVDIDGGTVVRTLNLYSELAYLGNNKTLLSVASGQLEEVSLTDASFIRALPSPVSNPRCIAFSTLDTLVFISDEYTNLIKAIRPSDGTVMYTIQYPITTALAGYEHLNGWLEVKEQIISIPAGQTGEVPIIFNSAGLSSGSWIGHVNLIPLNSNSNPLPVSVTLNVLSGTDIETAREIDFGNEYVGFEIDTTIIIQNRGFTNLVIDQIQSSDNRIVSSLSSVTLSPGQTTSMVVRVEPDGPGVIDAHITFTSNDPDEGVLSVPVRVNLLGAPGIAINRDSLNVTLTSGDKTTLTCAVTNTGSSTLHWNTNSASSGSIGFEQSVIGQNYSPVQANINYENDFDDFFVRAPSPETITCLSYDSEGGLIYARSLTSDEFYTYNPVLNQWSNIGLVPSYFYGQAVHLNGRIYHGGTRLNIYTIQSNSWSSVSFPITGSAISITSDANYVYIAVEKVLYRFDPVTQSWLELASVQGPVFFSGISALSYHSGVIFANGKQSILGDGNTLFFKYFIESNTLITSNSISGIVSTGSAIAPSSSKYFVVGSPHKLPTQEIQMSILDIKNGEWAQLAIPFEVGELSGLVFVDNQEASGVYFTQGSDGTEFGYYRTPSSPNWFTTTPTMGSIPAGDTQTILVNLNAQGLYGGTYQGSIRVSSAHPEIEKMIPLELKILGTPDVSISNVSTDIGEVTVGNKAGTSLVIKNTGTANLVVDSISISKASEFSIYHSYTYVPLSSFTVPIGETIVVSTSFQPTSIGEQVGEFTFHSNNSANPNFQYVLKGTGVYPSQLQVPTDTLKVTLFTGELAKKKFTITNTGNGKTQYLVVSGNTSWIKIDSAGSPVNIGAHNSREFEALISAEGFSQGLYYGSVWIEDHMGTPSIYYEIPVCVAVMDAPDIFTNLDSLNFESQFVNGHYDSLIQISNNGVLPLSISSIESDNTAFTISIDAPLYLDPGTSIDATVRFSPLSIGSQHGKIAFMSDDPDEDLMIITLVGNGVAPPSLNLSSTELHVSAFAQESDTETINLSNHGGSILKWRIIEQSRSQPSAADEFTSKASTIAITSPYLGLTTDPTSGLIYAHNYGSNRIYAYNALLNSWSDVGYTENPEYNFKNGSAVILNSKMYCTYAEASTKIYIYDMILKNWSSKINQLGQGTATITTDGTLLYLAGGGKFMSFNPKSNEWIELSTPNFILDGMGGLSYLDGIIYSHSASSNSFSQYTIATGIWEDLVPLPYEATVGSTIDTVNKRYYAYRNNYLYEYDIQAGIWTVHYLSLFIPGEGGGLSFTPAVGYEGVYIHQGNTGNGFAYYQPKAELAWLRSSQLIGEIETMDNQTIGINCNAINLSPGVFRETVKIISNDPSNLEFDIPVTFYVKNPTPIIKVPYLIADTVSRSLPTTKYLVIKNEGEKKQLEWSLSSQLPSWLSANKTSGYISSHQADSIEITFSPGFFPFGVIADHTLQISSNDSSSENSLVRFMLTIQNHQPVLTTSLPNQILISDQIEIPLMEHFKDPDNDPLSFSISTNNNSLLSTDIIDSKLIINPVKSGVLTITVTATDSYNSSAIASFDVNSLVTEIEANFQKINLKGSPNPFDDIIRINIDENLGNNASILLLDITSRTVYRSNQFTTQNVLEIDGSNFSPGIYTCILLVNDKSVKSLRLVKR